MSAIWKTTLLAIAKFAVVWVAGAAMLAALFVHSFGYFVFSYPSPRGFLRAVAEVRAEGFFTFNFHCAEESTEVKIVVNQYRDLDFPVRNWLKKWPHPGGDVTLHPNSLAHPETFIREKLNWETGEWWQPRCPVKEDDAWRTMVAYGYFARVLDRQGRKKMVFDLRSHEMGQYFIRWHGMVDGWDLSPDRHVDFIRKFNQDEDFDPPWGWLFMTGLAVGFSSPVILILLIFYVLNCHTRARHPIH